MPETTEEDFQTKANEYGKSAIANIREMIEAMEHSQECNGTVDCPDCDGTGCANTAPNNEEEDCKTCQGNGEIECPEGKDSDEPDAWHDEERARTRIEEDALSVEIRGDWHTPGDEESNGATEYNILLTTGGPAARIVGDLDRGQPTSAVFEFQDWFKPWTEVYADSADRAVLLKYAQCFYFGD